MKHLCLIQANEIAHTVIVLNKMDRIEWNEKSYRCILEDFEKILNKNNLLQDSKRSYVPISAVEGLNLIKKIDLDWYKGKSLLEMISKIEKKLVKDVISKPLRMTVKNIFSGLQGTKRGKGVEVKIETGILESNDKLLIMPTHKIIQTH